MHEGLIDLSDIPREYGDNWEQRLTKWLALLKAGVAVIDIDNGK